MSDSGYGLGHRAIIPLRLGVVRSGVCSGHGGIAEKTPDQYRLREPQRDGEETDSVSSGFRIKPGTSSMLSTHFATESPPQHQPA